jgi:uncharacterized caspase-like protein
VGKGFRNIGVLLLSCVAAFASAQDRALQIAPAKPAPAGERRVALVIGNSAYKSSPLRNPVRDARAISRALAETGFKVTVLENASETGMRRAIRAFGDELAAGGVGLFYYAGHGMQVRGRNYLIPVNADIEREDEVEDQAVDANLVLTKMDSAKNSLNLMILDACRNNPFARAFRSAAQGLAQMDAPSGTLVAFATAPGSVASDGDGENGLYTKHLLANMTRAGLPIEQLFKEVRIGVGRETSDRQVPWESSSLKGNFFFIAPDPSLSAEAQKQHLEKAVADAVRREQEKIAEQQRQMQAMIRDMLAKQRAELEEEMRRRDEALGRKPPPPAPVAAAPAVDREVVFWESIKNSTNPEDFKAYLAQYPKGAFTALARTRLTPAPERPAAPAPADPLADRNDPLQVASVAPTPVAAEALDPRFPKIGDRWQYEYKDTFKRETREVAVEVIGVSKDGILDEDNFSFYGKGARAHSANAELLMLQQVWMFSPYLQVFNAATPGARWDDIHARNDNFCAKRPSCTYSAKVTGRERVTTRAGTFDAVTVVVDLSVSGGGFYIQRRGTFWYAESAKRMVKSTVRTLQGNPWVSDYELELVSYKLN